MPKVPDVTPELPSPTWRLLLSLIGTLPDRAMSRSFGRLADVRLPLRARRAILGSFARTVGIDLSEVERPLDDYASLNAFFVRRLRQGVRSWPADPHTICSPVDGIIGQSGRISQGRAIQAKGRSYLVGDMLADAREAERFAEGTFLTIYLSPRHYHRIHTPCAGTVERADYVPGTLYPVNEAAVMHVPNLFARNERVICHLSTVHGAIPVVAVGAYNVGRISTAFDPEWGGPNPDQPQVSNRTTPPELHRRYTPSIRVEAGAEIMAFHLGSTVVLLFEPGVSLRTDLRAGRELKVGEQI